MRVLCVGRHSYLSEHLCSYFRSAEIDTAPAVGLTQALELARDFRPDALVCDYDLLVKIPLRSLERDEQLSRVPLIAVSLTRRPTEVHLLDINAIAGFLYLPTLSAADAQRLLVAADASASARAPAASPVSLTWPRPQVAVR